MAAGISAAAIGAGVALAGTATSVGMGVASSQSGKAAVGKSQQASQKQNELNMNMLLSGRDSSNALLDPYSNLGTLASQQLQHELGLGGTDKGKFGNLNQPYGMAQYKKDPGYTPMVNDLKSLQATPGYKFQLEQGLQSVNNSAAARGSLLSGKAIKEIDRYSQGVASQGYQSAWDRAQQAYQSAFNRNQSNTQQRYNQLSGTTAIGFNAANQQGNNTNNAYAAIANGNNGQQATNTAMNMYQADQTQNQLSNTNQALQGLLASKNLQSLASGNKSYDNIGAGVSNATKNWGQW